MDYYDIALIALALVLAALVLRYYLPDIQALLSRRREQSGLGEMKAKVVNRIRTLKAERREKEAQLTELKRKFLKRQLDEQTFRGIVQDIEKRVTEIDVELKELAEYGYDG